MKRFGTIFMLVAMLSGCFGWHPSRAAMNPLADIPQEELNHPQFALLPCDDGYFFAYKFSKDLSLRQIGFLAKRHIEIGDLNGINFDDQVVIVAVIEPKEAFSVSVDFRDDVVELREDFERDKFRVRKWHGDPRAVLAYLSDGVSSEPEITKGNRSEEQLPPVMPCGPKQEI